MREKIVLLATLCAGISVSAAQADLTLVEVDPSAPIPLAPGCEPGPGWNFDDLADFGIEGFDGPLTSTGSGPVPPGFLPDNISIDSQMDGPGGGSRGAGGTGLVGVGPSAGFGNPSNAVLANFFVDAYGIDFGVETCEFTWTAASLLGGPGYDLYVDGVFIATLDNDVTYTLSGGPWLEVWLHDSSGGGAEGLHGEALPSYPVAEIEVDIDIKFCSDPNAFNCRKNGVLPVTIFGTEAAPVADIDPSTLQLCNSDLTLCTNAPRDYSYADRGDPTTDLGAAMCAINPDTGEEEDFLNQDGFFDLDAAFEASEVKTILGDFCVEAARNDVSEALVIIGETYDGVPIFSVPKDDNTGIDRLVLKNK